jgi:hypothetical protein
MSYRCVLTGTLAAFQLLLISTSAQAQLVIGTGVGTNPLVRYIDSTGGERLFFAYDPGFVGGVHVALGDINGDGVLDIITGPGFGSIPLVRVFNGTDLSELTSFLAYPADFPGGVHVAAGDINGDGRTDIITGAGPGGGPHVRVWSGTDLAILASFYAYPADFPGGVSVAAGDVNGDGRADILTGAGPGGGPHLKVLSGIDLSELVSGYVYPADFPGGLYVAAGDVNGDGFADIITSAGPGGGPHVRVLSGANITDLHSFYAYEAEFTGGVAVAAGDFDGDNRTDIVTAPGPGGGPHILILRGTDLHVLSSFFGADPSFGGGVFVGSIAPPTIRFTSANTTTFTVGSAGSFAVTTAGPTPTLSVTGTLPSGVTFTDNGDGTGTLAGTPAAGTNGNYPLTFSATRGGLVVTQAFTLVVNCAPLTVTPGTLPNGTVNVAYSQPFAANGTPPHTFAISSGTLPSGLNLAAAGQLAGVPAQAGTFNFTVAATDSVGCTGSVAPSLVIVCPTITVSPTTVPNGTVGTPYSVTFTQTGANPPVSWTVPAGTLPAGLMLDALTGVLSGTPTAAGSFNFIVTVHLPNDSCAASVPITLTIQELPNQPPSFTIGPNQTVLEDPGAQTVTPWATNISPGPPSEAGQTVTFNITGNTNPALFSVAPAVSPTGTLTYTPASNASGVATITLVLQDNGGTANGGVDTSAPQSFTITVTPVNDAPSFTVGADQTVAENAGLQTVTPWATGLSAGPPDETGQTLTFAITNNTNPSLFSAGPAVSPTGTLTYTPAANANGTATITLVLQDNSGTANGGVDTSAPQSFTITLTPVNSAPSFTVGPNQTVLEDAGAQTVSPWATDVSAGPPDEAGQTVTFNITGNTNPSLFSVAPAVSPSGVLTFTPAGNATGTATITLVLMDDGGTADGGVDTSAPQSFTITVTPVNDAPSFVVGPNQMVPEDTGPQSVSPWATGISAGPADETAGQAVAFQITGNTNPGLFSVAPAVSPTGALTYTSAANASGIATITLVLQDNGGTANGGIDTSAPQSFTITVTPVNDPPVLTTPVIAYSTVGNTQLHVAGGSIPGLASIADPSGVLTKSGPTDIDGPGPFAVVPFSGATPNGTVALAADGTFTYVPNAGFTGVDSFAFQVTDSLAPTPGTINITVSERVWYVNNLIDADNPAGGDGRSTNAFDTLSGAEAASGANDIIFVFAGDTAATPLNPGITLQNGQKLHGEGIGLTVTGFGTFVPAGAQPKIASSTGNAVTVLANTANGDRTGIEIRGLDLASTTANAIDVTSANTQDVGVRISENTISGSGPLLEGIDINSGSTGTATLAVHDNAITAAGTGLDITRTSGIVLITALDDNVVSGDTGGSGIVITGPSVRIDAIPGGVLNPVNGGITMIGTGLNPIGGAGLALTGITGELSFADLDIFAGSTALAVTGTGPFTGATGTSIVVTPDAGTLVSNGGGAAVLSNLTANLQLGGLTSTNSVTFGVSLTDVNGNFAALASSAITNAAGTAFNILGGNATVRYSGTITDDEGSLVTISSTTGGPKFFGGPITDGNDGDGGGITLTNNAASPITFAGGLTLSTGANAAFTATGGGTIEVCDENPCNPAAAGLLVNTLTTTTGTALNVANTTIGANRLEFRSISANGAANGIDLRNTGSSGGLTVDGDGANTSVGGNASGGTISNATGADGSTAGSAIYLEGTRSVVLRRMTINGTNQNFAIRGANVTGFTMEYTTVSGTNGTNAGLDEGSVNFDNLLGSAAITSSVIEGGFEDNLNVVNTSATLNRLVITGSTFGFNNTVSGNNHILIESQNSGTVLNFTIQSSTLRGARADWINASNNSGSSMDAILIGNTFDNLAANAHPGSAPGGNRVVLGATGTMTFDVQNNILSGARGEAISVRGTGIAGGVTGTATGHVRNNLIGLQGTANSGSSEGSGIFIFGDGGSHMTVAVTGNTVHQYNNHGILLQFGDELNDGSVFNITVAQNTVSTPGNINADFNAIHLNNGTVAATDNFTSCVNIGGAGAANNVTGGGSGTIPPNNTDIRVRQRQSTTVRLPGYAGAHNDDAAVVAYLAGRNVLATAAASNTVPTGGGFIGGAGCIVP